MTHFLIYWFASRGQSCILLASNIRKVAEDKRTAAEMKMGSKLMIAAMILVINEFLTNQQILQGNGKLKTMG